MPPDHQLLHRHPLLHKHPPLRWLKILRQFPLFSPLFNPLFSRDYVLVLSRTMHPLFNNLRQVLRHPLKTERYKLSVDKGMRQDRRRYRMHVLKRMEIIKRMLKAAVSTHRILQGLQRITPEQGKVRLRWWR